MAPNEASEQQLAGLKEAFQAFNEVSGALQSSYVALQRQVADLQERLDDEVQANAALATQLTALLEALPGGVVMLDGGGTVRENNSTATQFLGEPLRDVDWANVCKRAFPAVPDQEGDLELRDGRMVSLAQRPLVPGPGRVLLFTDVTEQRKFQELLTRQRRLAAMGEMAAALAHQVRTPLSAAMLYASSAARPDLDAAHKDELINKATRCLHDLEQLIGDMLQFARGASFSDDKLDVSELFAAAEAALRPALQPGQSTRFVPPEPSLEIIGGREALVSAVLNLVTNALQHGGGQAHVCVETRVGPMHVDIRVHDNGPGVPAEDRERIFEPFFTSRPDGTGLGLAVVRSIARAHQGEVFLDTTGGTGATFVLRLPRPIATGQPAEDAAA